MSPAVRSSPPTRLIAVYGAATSPANFGLRKPLTPRTCAWSLRNSAWVLPLKKQSSARPLAACISVASWADLKPSIALLDVEFFLSHDGEFRVSEARWLPEPLVPIPTDSDRTWQEFQQTGSAQRAGMI